MLHVAQVNFMKGKDRVCTFLPDQQQEMLRNLGLEDGEDTLNDAVVMAGALIISAPVLVFFAFAQRQFMEGIERTGITGE